MSVVTPLERLAMAPKSLETSIQNVNKIQKMEMATAQVAENFKKEVARDAKQTVKSQKSDYLEYRFDEKKDGNGGGQKQRKNKRDEDPVDEDDIAAKIGRSFDIRI